ncbi:MAG: hypothetical protein JW797_17145 [Bradymonadales bacterium]|nr:hypothetical protein [Bradymonadales bacterium]
MRLRVLARLLLLLLFLLPACGGAGQATRGDQVDRFSRPPADQGETPPPAPVTPGDTPSYSELPDR